MVELTISDASALRVRATTVRVEGDNFTVYDEFLLPQSLGRFKDGRESLIKRLSITGEKVRLSIVVDGRYPVAIEL